MMTVTAKQKKIADLVAENLDNRTIAEKLGNTQGGVEQHLVKLYRKLGCNREELKKLAPTLEVKDGRVKRIVEVSQ